MTDSEILKVLLIAKHNYKITKSCGLCYHLCTGINIILNNTHFNNGGARYIRNFIPEFNVKYLNAENKVDHEYWWSYYDYNSRIKAFNKLIRTYRKKVFKCNKLFWLKSFFI